VDLIFSNFGFVVLIKTDYNWTKIGFNGAGFEDCVGRVGWTDQSTLTLNDRSEQMVAFGTPIVGFF